MLEGLLVLRAVERALGLGVPEQRQAEDRELLRVVVELLRDGKRRQVELVRDDCDGPEADNVRIIGRLIVE